jgi:hypothetical protein
VQQQKSATGVEKMARITTTPRRKQRLLLLVNKTRKRGTVSLAAVGFGCPFDYVVSSDDGAAASLVWALGIV